MGARHETIGVKQALRLEWMDKAASLVLAGLSEKKIRQELHAFLADKKGNGLTGERSEQTRNFAVSNLMNVWVSPATDLLDLRNASLSYLRERPLMSLPVHWAMISAVYPFWFNVARQAGRLLALQGQINQSQIITRLKEQYGDRQTVSRYACFVIRSFVAWGVMKDSEAKGCYEKSTTIVIDNTDLATLMIESALQATPETKVALGLLRNNPAFFPFQLPCLTGEFISHHNERINVLRYGLDDEFMTLKSNRLNKLTTL